MVGGLEAGRWVAAVVLLAVASIVPQQGPLTVMAHAVPVVDAAAACSVTVGAATADPALAAAAAREMAAGYATTDCMPRADLLAAEARAALLWGGATGAGGSGAVVGTSAGAGPPRPAMRWAPARAGRSPTAATSG